MAVTKEQVNDKAKELGVTLTDAQADVFVTLGVLPSKADSAPPAGDDNDDGAEEGDSKGVKERIATLAKQRREALAAKAKAEADLKVLKDKESAAALEKDKDKGNWEKLNKDAQDAKAKADAAILASKEKLKSFAVSSAMRVKLIGEGVAADRIEDAMKLIDIKAVEFTWTNEEALEFEIESLDAVVEKFKKEKAYLFGEAESETGASGFQGGRPPRNTNSSNKEKKAEELKGLFSALR